MKLNLGGGNKRFEGFINVDLYGDVEIHHDLNKAPYPFKDNSIDEIISEHCLEHLDKPDLFWKEVHRILKPKGTTTRKFNDNSKKATYQLNAKKSKYLNSSNL